MSQFADLTHETLLLHLVSRRWVVELGNPACCASSVVPHCHWIRQSTPVISGHALKLNLSSRWCGGNGGFSAAFRGMGATMTASFFCIVEIIFIFLLANAIVAELIR